MKRIGSISKLSARQKSKLENVKTLKQGIKKTLLEKYKPKGPYNLKNISEKNSQRRVA